MMCSDTFRMGYNPVPDYICHRHSPTLTYRTALDSHLDSNHDDNDDDAAPSNTVTIVNVEDLSELHRPPSTPFGGVKTERTLTSVQRNADIQQLRGAIGRMYLTNGGISYLLPANQTKISVDNLYKPNIAKAFDKELRVKERTLLNHKPGVVSAGDTPRQCIDISALRLLNGACLDSDRHAHRTLFEFLAKNPRAKHVDEMHVADIHNQRVVLPGSALSDRGTLRRRWMAISPQVKTMVGALGQPNLQKPIPWPSEHQLEMRPYLDMRPVRSKIRTAVPHHEHQMSDVRKQRVEKWVREAKLPPSNRHKNEILQQAMTRIVAKKWSRLRGGKKAEKPTPAVRSEGGGRGNINHVNIEIKIN